MLKRVQGVVRVLAEAKTQVDALLHVGEELDHGQLYLYLYQWLITHHAMRTICLLNLLPFLHSAPEPDTHLHVYLPKKSEQGNSVLVASFSTVSSKGENLERLEGLEGL